MSPARPSRSTAAIPCRAERSGCDDAAGRTIGERAGLAPVDRYFPAPTRQHNAGLFGELAGVGEAAVDHRRQSAGALAAHIWNDLPATRGTARRLASSILTKGVPGPAVGADHPKGANFVQSWPVVGSRNSGLPDVVGNSTLLCGSGVSAPAGNGRIVAIQGGEC